MLAIMVLLPAWDWPFSRGNTLVPPARRTCNRRYLFVCLLATLRQKRISMKFQGRLAMGHWTYD